jgi:beta-N-acetylhexosaminidase
MTRDEWIKSRLSKMSLDQKIGQLLHPFIHPQLTPEEIENYLGGIEPGGVFIFSGTMEETRNCAMKIQSRLKIPALISSDLECGAGKMMPDATVFPDFMALAAVDDQDLAYTVGKAAALEGRAAGIHWSFAPIVDINRNPFNPVTNVRSLGDDPEIISRMACAVIRGVQENGLCATAKHFPGDGFDSRDQHICTSINPLNMDAWRKLSGRTFQDAINAGVKSIMIGHIALPAIDPGDRKSIDSAPPATLSRRITTDLLRGEMGFDGLVISDASNMGGFTSWGPREEIVPRCIEAGCDQLLFCELKTDFDILKRSVKEGRLSMERVDEAVERVLACKHYFNLHENVGSVPLKQDDRELFRKAAEQIAERSLTLVRDRFGALPLSLTSGKKALCYHLRGDKETNVDSFDDLLRKRGVEVVSFNEDAYYENFPGEETEKADYVLVHFVYKPAWMTNRIRPNGRFMRILVGRIKMHDPRVVFISWGNPYIHLEIPRAPAVINAWSTSPVTQENVLKLLTGEIKARGKSPVNLELPPYWFPIDPDMGVKMNR